MLPSGMAILHAGGALLMSKADQQTTGRSGCCPPKRRVDIVPLSTIVMFHDTQNASFCHIHSTIREIAVSIPIGSQHLLPSVAY